MSSSSDYILLALLLVLLGDALPSGVFSTNIFLAIPLDLASDSQRQTLEISSCNE